MNKAILIFSGYNQRGIIAFLRTLKKHDVPYYIFARDKDDSILTTPYKEHVVWVREKKAIVINEVIERIVQLKKEKQLACLLIAPSTEYLNRQLIGHRLEFDQANCIIPLVDEQLYCKISDKKQFAELCSSFNIKIPHESATMDNAELPFVAKPIKYQSDKGKIDTPILIFTEEEKQRFRGKYDVESFFYQKYIDGKSIYLLAYIDKKGNEYTYSQQNLIQQHGGKSMILSVATDFHYHKEAEKYIEMLKKNNFHGLIMIEVKYEKERYYMIEANPRFWGPSQLLLDSNNNFFEMLLYEYEFLDSKPNFEPDNKDAIYFWEGGLLEDKTNNVPSKYYQAIEKSQMESYTDFDIYNKEDTKQIYENERQN